MASPRRDTTAAPAWRRWSSTLIAEFDLAGLRAHLEAALPAYARPLFLRFRTELDVDLHVQAEKDARSSPKASIPAGSTSRSISTTARQRAYRRLDAALFAAIVSGAIPL